MEHLPDGYITEEGLKDSLVSSQLLQALEVLDGAVCGEEYLSVLKSLELFDQTIFENATDPVDALIQTLIKKYAPK